MSISKLASSIKTSDSDFPPVHLWNPDLCIGRSIPTTAQHSMRTDDQ